MKGMGMRDKSQVDRRQGVNALQLRSLLNGLDQVQEADQEHEITQDTRNNTKYLKKERVFRESQYLVEEEKEGEDSDQD